MRLIDADDILDSIENWKRIVLYYHPHTKKFSTIPMSEVLSFLEDSPTIDAVPVVHGMWIETDDSLASGACSVCGWKPYYYEDDVYGMPYCPNCGAKMDGGKDNADNR